MSRIRMEWNWVGKYPVFVYMVWIDNNLWNVWTVLGKIGDQNAGGCGPTASPWFKYTSKKCSRHEVCVEALRFAKQKLKTKYLTK